MSTKIWTGAHGSDWADVNNWSPAGVPDASSDVVISLGAAVAQAPIGTVNSITDNFGLDFESAGTNNTVTSDLHNSRLLNLDDFAGDGGTTLNIGGTLTNSGVIAIGNTLLSSNTTVSAGQLTNTGKIFLFGSSTGRALLDVNSAAGFGTLGVLSGKVHVLNDSAIEFASGQITSLAANAQLHMNGNSAFIEDGTTNSNSALTGLASISQGAWFALHNNAVVSTTGSLTNDGRIDLDLVAGEGGSSLTVGGMLTNSRELSVGNATLSAPTTVSATALTNTGQIRLTGSASNKALLDVSGSAGFGMAGVLSGYVRLAGDSAIQFGSGQINSLADSAQLRLNGNAAFIEDGTTNSNSALTGLASIGQGAIFALHDQVAVSTNVALSNDGSIRLDFGGGDGGSSLTVGDTLTNSGSLYIGNATLSAPTTVKAKSLDNTTGQIRLVGSVANQEQALLDVAGSAGFGAPGGPPGVMSGYVRVAGDSAIEFGSGQITSLADSAQLRINGSDAFIEDSGAGQGSNSALMGLNSIGQGALFELENGASVSPTGSLVNDGAIGLDRFGGDGGSSLTVGATLYNNQDLRIGNTALSTATTVSAKALDNTTGRISLDGSVANKAQALLDVSGSAGFGTAGVLSGSVRLAGDSAIEFGSGQINSLAPSATLRLNGNDAFIEDSASGSNSALTGLNLIDVGATFELEHQVAVSITGALANDGNLEIDDSYRAGRSSLTVGGALTNNGFLGLNDYYRGGGSTLSIGGALTNSGNVQLGNDNLSALSTVTAKSLDNTDTGSISLAGSGANPLILNVSSVAGFGTEGELSGKVRLHNDSAIEFVSGQISTIDASSLLSLQGPNAFIEDGMSNSNSALTGLSNILGAFSLINGASASTGALTNSGRVSLDGGGSTLSIGDALHNNGVVSIANDTDPTYGAFVAGAVDGVGSFNLSYGHLQFNSSVSAGQIINERGANALVLEHAENFDATISGFGRGDTIDAANFLFGPTTLHFVENVAATGVILTLNDGSMTANLLLRGDYRGSDFKLAPDSGTGTLVKFV
jgi:hypothetical protein